MIDRLSEEAGARNSGNTDVSNHPFTEFKIAAVAKAHPGLLEFTDIDHHKVGALRGGVR